MSTATQVVVLATEPRRRPRHEDADARVIAVQVESDERLLLTVVEAARRIGVSRALMYELLGSGQIESIHIGRLRKVPVGALADYVGRLREQKAPG